MNREEWINRLKEVQPMPNMEKIVQMVLIMEFLVMWMSCLLGKDGILRPLV